MKNPRTTAAGVMTMLGAMLTFAGDWVANGVPTGDKWALLGAALTMGAGLIAAADGKKPE